MGQRAGPAGGGGRVFDRNLHDDRGNDADRNADDHKRAWRRRVCRLRAVAGSRNCKPDRAGKKPGTLARDYHVGRHRRPACPDPERADGDRCLWLERGDHGSGRGRLADPAACAAHGRVWRRYDQQQERRPKPETGLVRGADSSPAGFRSSSSLRICRPTFPIRASRRSLRRRRSGSSGCST